MLKIENNHNFSQQNHLSDNCEDCSGKNQVTLLTPREYDLYLLLLEGFTLKECAKQLSIKYSTANTHINSIYKKLGVNSRADLIIKYRSIKK
ncbi:MAG: helix-turn-helix transcriptional regulator [Syntrophomonas sp.]